MPIYTFILGVAITAILAWRISLRWAKRQAANQKNLLLRTRRAEELAQLGQLVGQLAHELRNPLSTVTVNLKLLSEDIADLAQTLENIPDTPTDHHGELKLALPKFQRQLRRIKTIRQESDRLAHTLTDFLQYAGKMELHLADQDINELIDDLVDFYEPQALNHNVKMRSQLAQGPIKCRVDPALIKQAILNLFINATQALENGGELIVQTHRTSQHAVIEITDTGPGIPPDMQEKIFQAYVTTRSGGTGIGLPMCQRIIDEHHGHIQLFSEPTKGTRFTIKLPLA